MNDQSQTIYESQPIKSDEVYANVMQEERVQNIIGQTSPDRQLIDIEWRIRGYRKNNLTNQWEKIMDAPEPHPLLVGRYMSFLGSLLNDNTRFTNLSTTEINNLMRICIEYLSDDMETNAKEYNLFHNYTERTRIGLIVLNTTFIVLKRSQNGMESGRIWKSLNMNENNNPLQNKGGFLDNFKFWKS